MPQRRLRLGPISIAVAAAAAVALPLWVTAKTATAAYCPTPTATVGGISNGPGFSSSSTDQCTAPAPTTTPTWSPGAPPPASPTPTPTLAQQNQQLAPCGWNTQYGTLTFIGGPTAIRGVNAAPAACPAQPAPPLTPATSPPPDLSKYYAQVFEEISTAPGTISAAPPNHTGLVNLPACFWLTGQSVPEQKQLTMDLKGAPNSAGKQITYHITLTVKLEQTTWTFGDGSNTQTPAPTDCVGISGDPLSLVAHNYVTYSNGDFMVTASETYAGSVTMTWTDDNGPEPPQAVAGPTQTVTTPPYPIQVDQEEAVGVG